MSSFMPHIEIWDLDVKEPVEPVAVLGVAENVEDMMFRQVGMGDNVRFGWGSLIDNSCL